MKGYKTIVFNVLMGVIMLVNQVWGSDLDPNAVIAMLNDLEGALTAVWAAGNVFLRTITTTPVFKNS